MPTSSPQGGPLHTRFGFDTVFDGAGGVAFSAPRPKRSYTPEEAWPLLQIVARQTIPTVIVGIGKPGVMLSVLGKKIGAPWTYAALEKGMEAYPGQPSVRELKENYHYDAIEKSTRFLGVTGFGEQETAKVAAFNALLAHQKSPLRCLPLGLGSLPIFRKVMDAVKLAGVVVDAEDNVFITESGNSVVRAVKQE